MVRALPPAGWNIFFLENNPWNPGTRYVMAHCAFDEDAEMILESSQRSINASHRGI